MSEDSEKNGSEEKQKRLEYLLSHIEASYRAGSDPSFREKE